MICICKKTLNKRIAHFYTFLLNAYQRVRFSEELKLDGGDKSRSLLVLLYCQTAAEQMTSYIVVATEWQVAVSTSL